MTLVKILRLTNEIASIIKGLQNLSHKLLQFLGKFGRFREQALAPW